VHREEIFQRIQKDDAPGAAGGESAAGLPKAD
jgi:sRNA-binding carbon storage regulator CsrA